MCENVCVCARVLAMNVGTRLPSRSPPSRLLEVRREWTEAEAEAEKGRGARERERGRETETDRQTDRQTEKETEQERLCVCVCVCVLACLHACYPFLCLPALACAYLHVSACARAHVWYCEWPVWHEHMVMYARLLDD